MDLQLETLSQSIDMQRMMGMSSICTSSSRAFVCGRPCNTGFSLSNSGHRVKLFRASGLFDAAHCWLPLVCVETRAGRIHIGLARSYAP